MLAAPQFAGPAIEIEFTTIVLHITEAAVADEMTVTALRLAGEQGARVVALYTLEVPADLPLLCARRRGRGAGGASSSQRPRRSACSTVSR